MPIYEYKCLDCDVKFDAIRLMKDADEPIACQACQGTNTKRTISVFFAQSGGRVIASENSTACSSCAGRSCASCGK